jgi:hypothetical protein
MVAMVERSGASEPEPTGWALVRLTVRELLDEWRHPRPVPARYLRCDGCGEVTPHTRERQVMTMQPGQVNAPPPEAVCDECGHAQPRMVGDEIPADATVTCVGYQHRRIRAGRSRRPCGRQFAVPAAAPSVLCPWCGTVQPGPADR